MTKKWEIEQSIVWFRKEIPVLEKIIKELENSESPHTGYAIMKYSKELEYTKLQLGIFLEAMQKFMTPEAQK